MVFSATLAYYLGLAKSLCQHGTSSLGRLRKPDAPVIIRIISETSETISEEIIESVYTSTKKIITGSIAFHLQTIFLFIYSDLKTVVIPWTLFGIAHALSAPVFGLQTTSTTWSVLSRTPAVIFWIILNLIPFTIGNQRQKTAIVEDGANKPWRPLPSKRVTREGALDLMLEFYFAAAIFSVYNGGVAQCIVLAVLGYLYNDLGGGDRSYLTRGLLNGLGFISFGSGAMEVALGHPIRYSPLLVQWLRIVALVVATGIHSMDMYDQAGDALVGRSTLPLVIGDKVARWSLVVQVLAWSVVCPWVWGSGLQGTAILVLAGALVARRTLKKREVKQDKKTAKLWNLWLVGVYCLPLVKLASTNISATV